LLSIHVVQQALQKVYDKGDVYVDEYEGWYSVAEERFITETEVQSGQFRDLKKLKELYKIIDF
jgi:methionyl-tRNA synthetase